MYVLCSSNFPNKDVPRQMQMEGELTNMHFFAMMLSFSIGMSE